MEIQDIITLEDNKEYLILDKVELDRDNYLYCVGIDKEEKPTDEYVYLKELSENNEYYIEEVSDTKTKDILSTMFTAKYIEDSINEEQDV